MAVYDLRKNNFSRLHSEGAVALLGNERFLIKLVILAFVARLAVLVMLSLTGMVGSLRLSPDSGHYHHLGISVAKGMEYGIFNWELWIDRAWPQFIGLVYYIFGTYPILILLFNIAISTASLILGYHIAKTVFQDDRIARITALFIGFFLPFIYWSCLLLRDSVAIFAISLIVLSVVKLKKEGGQFLWFFGMVIGLLLMLGLRQYLFFVLIFLILASMLPYNIKYLPKSIVQLLVIALLLGLGTQMAGFGFLGADYIAHSVYFDLEYINSIRTSMTSHGTGNMYAYGAAPTWGNDLMNDLWMALKAVFYFFVSLDLTKIRSTRQIMALPGILAFLVLLPAFFRGLKATWEYHRYLGITLVIFICGILVVYGFATTNLGALYRWRMQAMPFMMVIIAYGIVLYGRGYIYNLFMRFISVRGEISSLASNNILASKHNNVKVLASIKIN
jgi:4-amino-4-deoxy-L-arabinose transferase-like glycosyltransferase